MRARPFLGDWREKFIETSSLFMHTMIQGKSKFNFPLMGNLLTQRVERTPPFYKTGVDYAGHVPSATELQSYSW